MSCVEIFGDRRVGWTCWRVDKSIRNGQSQTHLSCLNKTFYGAPDATNEPGVYGFTHPASLSHRQCPTPTQTRLRRHLHGTLDGAVHSDSATTRPTYTALLRPGKGRLARFRSCWERMPRWAAQHRRARRQRRRFCTAQLCAAVNLAGALFAATGNLRALLGRSMFPWRPKGVTVR